MLLFMDGFDQYGPGATGISNMLDGVYAAAGGANTGPGVPPWGPARTGSFCYVSPNTAAALRKVLPGTLSNILVGAGVALDSLPTANGIEGIVSFRNAANNVIAELLIQSTGTLAFSDKDGNVLALTATPVIVAQNWHFIEMQVNTSTGAIRVDVDGITVIASTVVIPAPTGGSVMAQLGFGRTNSINASTMYIDDLTIRDTTGTFNKTFEGDLRVATLFPNADGPDQGWTPEYRHKLGTGILSLTGGTTSAPAVIYTPSSTSTNLPAGDFTLEGFFRFNALPTGGNKSQIFGKWDETNNRRSYQLYLGGPTLENGNLVFRTSTSGAAGTVVENISFPWPGGAPDLFTWYHLAIVRASGELLLFIDGNQYGVPIADASTYFVGTAPLSIGAQVEGTTTVTSSTGLNGWADEIRITPGVARYTSNFIPTTVPFPRSVAGGDPDFANVALLCGFDSGVADESSFARPVNRLNNANAVTPDDGVAAFQTLAHPTPQDDTFIEAALIAAAGTLTLAGQPTNGQTVTVGTYSNAGSHAAVYTFNTVLGAAFSVLIGATIAATLTNLQNAINLGAGVGVTYGTGTIANDDVVASGLPSPQMLATAKTQGTGGNAIASTSTLSGGSGWGAATLTGGADIPGDSDFFFQRPPPNTTIIKAVQTMTRSFKSDAGVANVQTTLVGPLGGTTDGADNPLTVSANYYVDIFETDPDTGGSLTPSTIVGGRVRVNRTA